VRVLCVLFYGGITSNYEDAMADEQTSTRKDGGVSAPLALKEGGEEGHKGAHRVNRKKKKNPMFLETDSNQKLYHLGRKRTGSQEATKGRDRAERN